MLIKFLIPKKVTLNEIYSGKAWYKRAALKESYLKVPIFAKPIMEYPVRMHYHFLLDGNGYDISNHAYMIKLIEDCLVEKGILKGDNQKFVKEIKISAAKSKENVCYINFY